MPLKCSFKDCSQLNLADFSQIAFYQDLTNGGWNLALGPEYVIPGATIPVNIRLVGTSDERFPYNVHCANCQFKVGIVNLISGFERMTVNFSARNVYLSDTKSGSPASKKGKWSKLIDMYPDIRRITATIPNNPAPLVALDTVHFHGVSDLDDIIEAGKAVASKSDLSPKDYQWRGFCFACLNSVLLCLPTGMGKTLIACMLMKAYQKRNSSKGQVFLVPTVVLVDQQASAIERNTGFNVIRRSGDEFKRSTWSPEEICVCTADMLFNAIKLNQIAMSQISLLIFDEVHLAHSPNSNYGRLLPYISRCPETKRPRVLGLTASPCLDEHNMSQSISSLRSRLGAVPYTPLLDDSMERPNRITCNYVAIEKTEFEMEYERFVIESLNLLSALHPFYQANWKTFPRKFSVQSKIDTISKSISMARLVGQDEDDIQLLQLTAWMRKWLDSLNILQIFGPAKLIQLIRADLDYLERDRVPSKHSAQLAPIIQQLRESVEKIFTEHQIAENSPRLLELLSILEKHHGYHERILIFVERRSTAERLCRRLKDDPLINEMNPISVVGNTNCGSTYKDVQQKVLEMFRAGECRLLVATSVLEQGIDVAMCGLVICFDGIKSVKSIIQARGRARMDIATFVAFVSADKQQRANQLTQMEVAMNYTIRQLMTENHSALDQDIGEELDQFLLSDDRNSAESYLVNDESDGDDDDEMENDPATVGVGKAIKLWFVHFVNSTALLDHIQSYDRVKVSKRFIDAQFTVPDDESMSRIIKEVSSIPRFRSWIEVNENSYSDAENISRQTTVLFDSLTGCFFEDFTTVNFDLSPIWCDVAIEFRVHNNEMEISANNRQFRIHAINVETILIGDTLNSLEIFLCLRNPPAYFIDKELAHFDFTTKSFNLCLQRKASIDCETSTMLRRAFHAFTMNVFNVCHLKKSNGQDSYRSVNSQPVKTPFMTDYLIKVWHSTHSALLPTILPQRILERFYKCSSLVTLKVLLNNTTPVRFQKLKIRNVQDVQLPFLEYERHAEDYVSLCRVNVTPSRFVYLPMQSVQKNRIFRYYPDPENFLLISFTDENGGNPWRSANICDWFLDVLRNGIKIGDKTFTFLGCSNSQLREGRCWFSTLNRDDVYDKIGEFPDTWSAGRKLTRLALAFAASSETVALNERYLHTVANDVERNGVNFSDGIGRASHSLVEKLQSVLKLPQKPTAFQIRVGGIKGVISAFHQDDEVTFRKSMKKFESKHNILEVLNYSRSLPLFLNRHVILLLSSYGIPDDTFLDMQHTILTNCMDTLVDDSSSLSFVQSRSKIFDWELFPPQHLVREPFFTQMLISNSVDLISGITDHSHIPVQNGRILMGVLDETETLEYGEIYAHIVESDFDYELEGRVLIFRNPCVLPSDIRVLTARKSCSALRNLYTNCLVMPSKGPSSHASECSGGDLDGDLYYVIWDENLVPKGLQIPGEKVVQVKTTETVQTCSSNHESMLQFYCDYVSKNQLGIVANAHLAVADQFSMRDERSIELAKYVTAETDAPKKGYTVGKIPAKLLPSQYPDFMQKADKASYRSETILGELFRQSKPILEVFLEKRRFTTSNSKFSINGDTNSIENCYAAYCYETKTLLQSFDLESEVDLFSGTPIWKSEYLSTYKQEHQLRQNVLKDVGAFWRKWKTIFDKWRSDNDNNQEEIVEWYSRPKLSPWPIHSFSFLALPYVNFDECIRKTISQKILDSTHRWVVYNKIRWLNDWRTRYNIYETVTDKLNGIECHLYGSSALGLNEEHSDIDLCATSSDFANISKSLCQMDHNVAILKKPHCVALTYKSQHIEITNFLDGVRKTNTLASTLDRNVGCWVALKVLIEWARIAKIVKSCGSEGLMTVISFCHLFISFATTSAPQTDIENTPPSYTLKRFASWIDSVNDSGCGTLIYDFLKQVSSRNRLWLITKVDPITKEPLIKRDLVDELCQIAEVALCILSVHDGDVQKLFEFCTKKRLFRLDKRYVDPTTSTEASRTSCLKELKTVCNPKNAENLHLTLTERNGFYYVEVSGDHKHFADVEKGINKIHWKIMNVRVRDVSRKKIYHVVNATIILPEFGNGPSTEVSFTSYEGDRYHVHHMGMWKSTLKLRNDRNANWRELEHQRYENRFLKQMEWYEEKQRSARKSTRCLRFFGKLVCIIRCGHHYFFHIPEALHNTFETMSLQNVEEKVAHMEENLELERQHDIIQDMKNYNSSTLVRSHRQSENSTDTLALIPLHELKTRSGPQRNKSLQFKFTSKMNDVNGIRHSFYTDWRVPLNETKQFAAQNGFKEIPTDSDDYYTSLTVFWRQRELNVLCDKVGRIKEIKHRKVRWLSATFNKIEEDRGHDVRVYLESQTPLDDDETNLKTVIEYLDQRSIFTEAFSKQLQDNRMDQLPSKPLIPDIYHFNWRYRSMRIVATVMKFVNAENDECVLSEIHDGIFHAHSHGFEWFPKHLEFEFRLSTDKASPADLCKKSYDLGLKVFDHAKLNCAQ